jgi:hypothetical protein
MPHDDLVRAARWGSVLTSVVRYLRRHHLAVLALFVALGGTSYAAISSVPDASGVFHACVDTRTGALRVVQRAGSCRKTQTVTRRGKRVRVPGELAVAWNQRGQPGQPGQAGQAGQAGQPGQPGQPGAAGRSALSVLQSGETIHGAWALQSDSTAPVSVNQLAGITLPIPAPQPIDSDHVVVAGNDDVTGDGCSGSSTAPVAAPGFACIYFAIATGTTAADGLGARTDLSNGAATGDGSPYGFVILVQGTAGFFADGTWAYTAP